MLQEIMRKDVDVESEELLCCEVPRVTASPASTKRM